MSVLPYIDVGLALLVIAVAISTIAARDLFTSVVSYVAYGLLLAFVWIRLYAPDVALTEAAVGGGVTGVLLITAGKRLGTVKNVAPEAQPGLPLRLLTGLLAVLVASALGAAILTLPDPPPSLAPQAALAADGAGAGLGNPITAVLMSYRSFDTMLEKVALFLAVFMPFGSLPTPSVAGVLLALVTFLLKAAVLYVAAALVENSMARARFIKVPAVTWIALGVGLLCFAFYLVNI